MNNNRLRQTGVVNGSRNIKDHGFKLRSINDTDAIDSQKNYSRRF